MSSRRIMDLVSKLLPNYEIFNPENVAAFYNDIYRHNEFEELREIDWDKRPNGLYNHQLLLRRLLGPLTGIQHQLVFYGMGLGKSIIYISLIDAWRAHIEGTPLILVRSAKLASVLRREIIKISRHILRNGDFPPDASTQQINATIRDKYNIQTYHKYAMYLARLSSDEYAREVAAASNNVIIMDEVQHLRDNEQIKMYTVISDFIREARDSSHVYLFTGTPMIDDAREFENIINLILPEPISISFGADGLLKDRDGFARRLAGHVSYLKFNPSDIRQETRDKQNFQNSGLYIEQVGMSAFQSYHYYRALSMDGNKEGLTIDRALPNITETYVSSATVDILVAWLHPDAAKMLDIIASIHNQLQLYTRFSISLNVSILKSFEQKTPPELLDKMRGLAFVKSAHEITKSKGMMYDFIWIDEYNFDDTVISRLRERSDLGSFVKWSVAGRYTEELPPEFRDRFVRVENCDFLRYSSEMGRFMEKFERELENDENLDSVSISESMRGALAQNKQSAAYANACQASLFVYPDGSFGRTGELKYIKNTLNAKSIDDWIEISRRYPPNCTIYTEIISEWKRFAEFNSWAPTIIHAATISHNVVFLNRVLHFMGIERARDVRERRDAGLYYIIQYPIHMDSDAIELFKKEVMTLIHNHSMRAIFMVGNEAEFDEINEYLNLSAIASVKRLGKYNQYKQTSDFRAHFAATGRQNSLNMDMVRKCSAKYGAVIDQLKQHPDKKVYIYSELIGGSGITVLVNLLDILGYRDILSDMSSIKTSDIDDPDTMIRKLGRARRYAFISSKVPDQVMDKIIAIYNRPENATGEYIQVFMGTETVSEGISLYDTDTMFDITANWNIASLEQAEHRICRVGSFAELKRRHKTDMISINTRRLAAIPVALAPKPPIERAAAAVIDNWIQKQVAAPQKSIDIYMFESCIKKDKLIKQVENVCKTAATDCQINLYRNLIVDGVDGERSCEYQACNYKCDFINVESGGELISNMYNMYYVDNAPILRDIRALFKSGVNAIAYDDLVARLYEHDQFGINRVLYELINTKAPIHTELGFVKVLCYDRGILYLSNIDMPACVHNAYYQTALPSAGEVGYQTAGIKAALPSADVFLHNNIHTMEEIYEQFATQYKTGILNKIGAALDTGSAAAIDELLKDETFNLSYDENMVELLSHSYIHVQNAAAERIQAILAPYVIQLGAYKFITITEPYLMLYAQKWAPVTRIYDSLSDSARRRLEDLFVDYARAILRRGTEAVDILKNMPQHKNDEEIQNLRCIYGTFQYTNGRNVFHIRIITNNEQDINLLSNTEGYLMGKRKSFIITTGTRFESLDKPKRQFLAKLFGVNQVSEQFLIDEFTKRNML